MYLSPPQEKEKQIEKKRKKVNNSEVALDDILLGKPQPTLKKNTRRENKEVYNQEKIIKKILRTKATIILN